MRDGLRQKIIKDLNLEKLPADKRDDGILMIGKLIFQGVIVKAMGLIEEKDKEGFDNLLMEKVEDEQAILSFLQEKVPNLDELVDGEIAVFKKENMDFLKNLK